MNDDLVEKAARALCETDFADIPVAMFDKGKDAEHYGSCTGVAQACNRCVHDEVVDAVRHVLDAIEPAIRADERERCMRLKLEEERNAVVQGDTDD